MTGFLRARALSLGMLISAAAVIMACGSGSTTGPQSSQTPLPSGRVLRLGSSGLVAAVPEGYALMGTDAFDSGLTTLYLVYQGDGHPTSTAFRSYVIDIYPTNVQPLDLKGSNLADKLSNLKQTATMSGDIVIRSSLTSIAGDPALELELKRQDGSIREELALETAAGRWLTISAFQSPAYVPTDVQQQAFETLVGSIRVSSSGSG